MGSLATFSLLRGNYTFRDLFFIIIFVQVLVKSVLTAQFYLIENESSSEFTVIKSFPVATMTSCVLECSVSSNICNKTEIELKENSQKVCHLLQEKPQVESKGLSNKSSSETVGNGIRNQRSFILSSDISVQPISKECKFDKEESVYIRGWVIQKQNLCYDSTTHILKTGLFKATQHGKITQVKLVHVQGFVQRHSNALKIYWGAANPKDDCTKDKCFGTLIVNANRKIVFPYNTEMSVEYNFNLKDFTDPKSTFITMSRESNPYMVKKDEEFQIMLGSQFMGKDYLDGTHCVDVYFMFE